MAPAKKENIVTDLNVLPGKVSLKVENYLREHERHKNCSIDSEAAMETDDDDDDVTIVQLGTNSVHKISNIVTEPSDFGKENDMAPNISLGVWEVGWEMTSLSHIFITNMESVLLIVVDLDSDLGSQITFSVFDEATNDFTEVETGTSHLEQIIFWINSFYNKLCFSSNTPNPIDGMPNPPTVNPNIIVVGTNKYNLHSDPKSQDAIASLKMEAIRVMLEGQPFEQCVSQPFYALDGACHCPDDRCQPFCRLGDLKRKIYHLLMKQPLLGQKLPEQWVGFQKIVEELQRGGIAYANACELSEKVFDELPDFCGGVDRSKVFRALLSFYHELGLVYYWGSEVGSKTKAVMTDDDHLLLNTVIINVKSFTEMLHSLLFRQVSETWAWERRNQQIDGVILSISLSIYLGSSFLN